MNYLDTLLQGQKVEWKTLGEVAEYVRGLTYNKSNESSDKTGYKVIRANNINLSRHTLNFDDVKYIKRDTKVKESQKLFKNDILISAASGSREHVGKVAYIFSDLDYYFGGFMGVIRCKEQIKPRYLFHVLTSGIFQKHLDEMLNSSTINNLSSSVINAFPIPIPPLSVQKEIVRILDTFTELTAELTTELTARKKQYEFYREQLLRVNDEGLMNGQPVEWKTLGEVGEVRMCKRILKEQTTDDGEVPFYKIGTFGKEPNAYISKVLFNEYKTKYNYPKVGEVLISASGTIGRAVIFDGKDAYFQDSNIVWIENDESKVLNKYLYYFYQVAKWEIANGGTIQRLYNDNIKKTKITIPPLEEQTRIVSILDTFDTLTTSISEGLPKEIELRKKQYEYYRNQLLMFNG